MEKSSDRHHKRRNLIYHLAVHDDDAAGGDPVGRLVDITSDGLKLVSSDPIESGRRFKLRMELPEGHFDQQEWQFEATSRWASRDVNPAFYTTGFTLENVDEAGRKLVAKLIKLYGFHD